MPLALVVDAAVLALLKPNKGRDVALAVVADANAVLRKRRRPGSLDYCSGLFLSRSSVMVHSPYIGRAGVLERSSNLRLLERLSPTAVT